jgi:hypothetical protein
MQNWVRRIPTGYLASLYAAVCCGVLLLLPPDPVGPGSFFVLVLLSLLLGFMLIVMQINPDSGKAIRLLSGEIIPAARLSPERRQGEREIRLWVRRGKPIFFFLSIFILVYWVLISYHGLPQAWLDKGYYSFLMYLYISAAVGKDYTTGNYAQMGFDFSYIYYPFLLGLPYSGFIYWALYGRRPLSEITDNE